MDDDLKTWLTARDPALAAELVRLQELAAALQTRMRERFDRQVPLADLLEDRWARARRLGFGDGASIYDSALVLGPVQVGAHTWIGPQTILDGSGGLRIGTYCSISAGVQIYSHDSVAWARSGGTAPLERAPVVIGDRCYLGPQTVVAKGVTIGSGCVIGACSLVLHDLPSDSKAFGVPARVVGPADG